jgi:uncharacterized membrane protein
MDQTALAAFIGGLIVFFGMHAYSTFRSREPDALAERMGGAYKGLYSVVSLAAFVAFVWGYANVGLFINVWNPPSWTRHVAMTLMLPALVLIVAAYTPTGYIKKAVKHPMLTAVKLWALAHLTANGDLMSMILFSAFLVYAVVDRIAVKRRGDRGGAAVAKPNIFGDLLALAIGIALYAALVTFLHQRLFGVPVVLGN